MSFKILLLVTLCVFFLEAEYSIADNIYCNSYTACRSNKICCNNRCVHDIDCAGRSCDGYSSYDQCSGLICCDGTCEYSCYNPVPVIIGIVVGVSSFIVILVIAIYCFFRRRSIRRGTGGYIITNPQAYTTTTTTNYNQIPTYYPPQQPYSQQDYGQRAPQQGYGAI